MPDRSLRLQMLPPLPVQGREHSGMLLRERPATPPDAPSGGGNENGDERGRDGRAPDDRGLGGRPPEGQGRGGQARDHDGRGGQAQDGGAGRGGRQREDNPFAPPPEGTPDRPWQPRRPAGEDGSQGSGGGGGHSPWGSQWSDRQPGRSSGGFGDRPRGGQDGPGGGGPGTGLRWDPTDPAQRRARYALLSGMWAFFFALFSWPYVALLLGALALYWGISSLRTKPRTPDPNTPTGRPHTTAAVSGLVTASLALAVVAAGFTAQMVYRDYYTCTSDALTNEAKQSCNELLPEELRGVLGNEG